MKNQCWKKGIVFVAAAIGGILLAGADTASAKTGKVELNLTGTPVQNRWPQALKKARKVTIKCSKPSVVKVKYKKNRKGRRIVFTGKKKGTATVMVTCHLKNKKKKTYRYKVRVVKGKKVSDLARAKVVLCQEKEQVKRELHLNIFYYAASISSFLNSFQYFFSCLFGDS